MNEYDRDLHRYCLGEIRVDGWKSDWRKEFERRHDEEAAAEAYWAKEREVA